MTRSAAAQASEAADALRDWLRDQTTRKPASSRAATSPAAFEEEFEDDAAAWAVGGEPSSSGPPSGRGLGDPDLLVSAAMRLPTPDWLHHRMAVVGPTTAIAQFRQAAAGAGIIPWSLDLERLEEDLFHLLVAPERRSLGVAGARIFARQLRDAVARRHELAVSRVGRSRACLFDLHALVPVPPQILDLGPDAPEALAWMGTHWGTTEPLRHVAEDDLRGSVDAAAADATETSFRISFWSADWTPWRALQALEERWPTLRFNIRPTYNPP